MANIATLLLLATAVGCGSVAASKDAAGNTCQGTQVKCSGECVDPSSDLRFCGASADCSGANAGKACSASEVCNAGTCSCPTGLVDCGGSCIDPSTDSKFCGATGTCTGASVGVSCVSGDSCVSGSCASPACQHGAVTVSEPASHGIKICKDTTNVTCEQDFETLCPLGWHLCSNLEFYNRNNTWSFTATTNALGEIYCRPGVNDAGSYTVSGLMSTDFPLNCSDGSSRVTCVTSFGCNEQSTSALCCAPSPLCGNGVVDAPEEQCDDANFDETDNCLNSCSWRQPSAHSVTGC